MLGMSQTSGTFIENCYVSASVPGKRIVEYKGTIVHTEKAVDGDVTDRNASFFRSLVEQAIKKGANAVVNARIAIGGYQELGSNKHKSFVVAYGDAVCLTTETKGSG